MWYFVLIVVGLWNGAFSADQSCIEGLRWACDNYDLLPEQIPGTENELKKACSEMEKVKKCLLERLNECGSNNYDDLEIARSDLPGLIATLTEICQEDTESHASYVQHMSCIKETFFTNGEKCQGYTNRAFDYLRGPIQRKRLQDDPEYRYQFFSMLGSTHVDELFYKPFFCQL
ncbi:hypothetical protein CEXT_761121 [Caerostris extrusa]|uniref:Secreted protein n=1 Tax=Caerostris extrusa TaxID=172846 RepID=A0AAV4REH9_CAEEX|nr:hypothetical protein CEXT_761121 [Caerostris extrusa]